MPLPTPREGEQREEFVERCMADGTAQREFPRQDQRRAVCGRRWRKSRQPQEQQR